MWAAILPIVLPAIINIVAYAYKQKMLSDAQMATFLDFVHSMSIASNNSKIAHDKFKKMYNDLKGAKNA